MSVSLHVQVSVVSARMLRDPVSGRRSRRLRSRPPRDDARSGRSGRNRVRSWVTGRAAGHRWVGTRGLTLRQRQRSAADKQRGNDRETLGHFYLQIIEPTHPTCP